MTDLDQALQLVPDFQPARLNRGVVHWLHGEHEQAIADFSAALDASGDKRLYEAAFYRGQVLLDQRREREAVADFSTVLAEKPDFQLAYWFRALANFRLGDVAAGEADVRKFAALDPRQPVNAPAAATAHGCGKGLSQVGAAASDQGAASGPACGQRRIAESD